MKKILKLKRIINNIIKELDDELLYHLYEGAGGYIGTVGEIENLLLYDAGSILDNIHSGKLEEWQAEEAHCKLEELNRSGSKKIGQWWWTYPYKEYDITITIHIGNGVCINIIRDNGLKITIDRLGF